MQDPEVGIAKIAAFAAMGARLIRCFLPHNTSISGVRDHMRANPHGFLIYGNHSGRFRPEEYGMETPV
jgi:hypothetical protein